jgi:hypothetical protein
MAVISTCSMFWNPNLSNVVILFRGLYIPYPALANFVVADDLY